MSSGSTWFMDAAALGGWTARGTSKVLQDKLRTLPADQCPAWMEGLPPHKVEEVLTRAIAEAVEVSQTIQTYMDVERAKGRDFEEIYESIPSHSRCTSPHLSCTVLQFLAQVGRLG